VEPLTRPSVDGDPSESPVDAEPADDGRGVGRTVFEWVGLVVIALVIALLIKTFLFQAFYIPSESMVPTLKVHDRVLVNKLSYKLHPVHRGDIVVFKAPPHADPGIGDLVKAWPALQARHRRPRWPCTSTASGCSRVSARHVTTSDSTTGSPKFLLGDGRQPRQFKDSRVFGSSKSQIVGGSSSEYGRCPHQIHVREAGRWRRARGPG
jgi:hypothetical protein